MSCQSPPKWHICKTLGHLNPYALHYYICIRNTTIPQNQTKIVQSLWPSICCHRTHPSIFSNRLAGEPTISPRVQNICPRKSWRSSGREGRETGEQGGGDVHTVDEIQGLKWFPFAPQLSTLTTVIKKALDVRWTLRASGKEGRQPLTTEHSM